MKTMNKDNVVRLDARQKQPPKDPVHAVQENAVFSSIEQEATLLKSLQVSYKNLGIERAKFLLALLNPEFFQKCLESLEGAQLAVVNYWAFGSGLFFYRHSIGVQIGGYKDEIIWQDELTEPQLLNIAMRLQRAVQRSDRILEGERIK